jgi:hypothetical protein
MMMVSVFGSMPHPLLVRWSLGAVRRGGYRIGYAGEQVLSGGCCSSHSLDKGGLSGAW